MNLYVLYKGANVLDALILPAETGDMKAARQIGAGWSGRGNP
ncbi:hypothetical protein TGS27_1851 [Geobacillus stearothermophilus]|uniref:Uncharacterized protein n=1 Tax=Geobacillus stearothermophilus TaxID=1422 RepID=A0A150MT75_GEOSE|nr:hypothetical protein GARCT_00119 [Geobacillus sp. 12AMOR1]KAF6511238.1 hypothetical protein GS8_1433 [Geobacillus stearothermophilus]STO35805.1 Uncharacterised protein [[Flavobacterium] thermophilum]KYD27710.1 hypothetical protein B4109_0110 [Geobacillus stearothermophilus]KYD31882.1 hypothetical protein B4114_0104 [Geobacillus stearothermophilus]